MNFAIAWYKFTHPGRVRIPDDVTPCRIGRQILPDTLDNKILGITVREISTQEMVFTHIYPVMA